MIILICNIRWQRQCLTVRTSVMMVHTCPFEPGWLKSNLSTMSKQRLGSELKQNSQSFVKPPALFALQALANKAEDLVFHCRFHCSPHKPDQQCCWKRHGGDSHLRWKGVQLDAACCSYTQKILIGCPSEDQPHQENPVLAMRRSLPLKHQTERRKNSGSNLKPILGGGDLSSPDSSSTS